MDSPSIATAFPRRAGKEKCPHLLGTGIVWGCHKGDTSDGLPYEKRVDGKGEAKCIENSPLFMLPAGWVWARLGSLSAQINYGVSNSAERSGSHKLLRITDINQQKVDWNSVPYTTVDEATATNCRVSDGDILFARIGATVGKTYLATGTPRNTVYASYLIRVQALLCDAHYLINFFDAPYYWEEISSNAVGSGRPNVNGTVLSGLFVPVPPLAEQRRIAGALGKYLALLDEIERDQADLDGLLAQLKSKVLDLAIRGELTERDPGDEPASELLTCIREEKLAMVARGELKPKDVKNDTVIFTGSDGLRYEKRADGRGETVCIEDEIPFEIPDTWAWARLGSISNYGRASSVKPTDIHEKNWVLDLEDIESGTGRLLKRVVKEERDVSSSKRHFDTGEVLYGKLRPYLNKVLISDAPGYCSTEIMPIALYGQTDPTYILFCLMSDYFVKYANHCSYGMNMPRLGTKDGQQALIPIPPINEQTRIVQGVKAMRTVVTNL